MHLKALICKPGSNALRDVQLYFDWELGLIPNRIAVHLRDRVVSIRILLRLEIDKDVWSNLHVDVLIKVWIKIKNQFS